MEKEKNGTESENSVTSGTEINATEEQQQVSEETGNLEEQEPDSINTLPDQAKADSAESEVQQEDLPQSVAEPATEDTPKEGTVDEPIAEEGNTESEPTAPEEEPVVEAPKLVTETSELSKEIESEELVPAGDMSIVAVETDKVEDKSPAVADTKVEIEPEGEVVEEEKQEEVVEVASEEKDEESTEVEVEKANEIVEEHPVDRHEDDDHHETYEEEDFSKYTKEHLVDVVKLLGKDDNPIRADKVLYRISPFFNKIKETARAEAAKQFEADGGDPAEFSYKPDELVLRFDANYRLIKDKKAQFLKGKEREKQSNLGLAEEVLDKLRQFVDSEESSASFDSFKVIQNEWKAIGDVPGQHSRSLWANYNALIHRFYDQRSIYFELKELDRKKNYDTKVKLCERAEALEGEPIIRDAIKELNDLHYDYKHMGPVPRKLQE